MVHEQRPPPVRVDSKLVFLVEDDTDIIEMLLQIIAQETQHDVAVVSDGFEALNVAKEVKPQLFIVDYMLPGMNGLELYDHLHAIEEVADTPVIMLSASLPTKEIQKRKITRISKPFSLDELLDAIETLLA